MFEIGWTEIIIVIIVASLMLDLKDIPSIIKQCKQAIKYCNDFIDEIKKIFLHIEQESKKIIDLDGKEQITYDLSDVMPNISDKPNDTTSHS